METKSHSFAGINNSKASFILEEFTKELIMNSGGEIFRLENILKEEKREENMFSGEKEKKEKKHEKEKEDSSGDETLKRKLENFTASKNLAPRRVPMSLSIPRSPLPPRFQYLKPTPTNTEIELGKLNPLIKDPLVKTIECNGPNQSIFVTGSMGRKKTSITLDKEEIDGVVKKFSQETKIPAAEGVFKVVAGRLMFYAVISGVVGSKFVIKKMMYSPAFRGARQR